MYRFLVIIEKAEGNYSAYSPDLPGCISTGATREDAERNMHQAIEMHVRGLLEDDLPIPETTSFAEYVAVIEVLDVNSSLNIVAAGRELTLLPSQIQGLRDILFPLYVYRRSPDIYPTTRQRE